MDSEAEMRVRLERADLWTVKPCLFLFCRRSVLCLDSKKCFQIVAEGI